MSEFSPRKNRYIGTEYTSAHTTLSPGGLELVTSDSAVAQLTHNLRDFSLDTFRSFEDGSLGDHAVGFNNRTGAAVFRHKPTGLYVKAHPSERDARKQFDTMNVLATRFEDTDDLRAVQHYGVIEGVSHVTSIIEAAHGTQLPEYAGQDLARRREVVADTERRIARALGPAGTALALDLDLASSGNVFVGDSDIHTIIDQPGPVPTSRKLAASAALYSLRLKR